MFIPQIKIIATSTNINFLPIYFPILFEFFLDIFFLRQSASESHPTCVQLDFKLRYHIRNIIRAVRTIKINYNAFYLS